MTKDELVVQVRQILADQFGLSLESVRGTTNIETDLNADSLDWVEIIMEVEEEFDISVVDKEVEEVRTVEEFTKYLWSKVATTE